MVAVEGVPKPVLDHGVDELQIAHLLTVAQVRCVRRLAHALLATGDDDAGVAHGDLLVGQRHRTKPRTADLVQAPRRRLDPHAGLDGRLAGRALARAGLQHLAQDHLVDFVGGHLGSAERRLDRHHAQFAGGEAGKGSIEGSDGGAGGRGDHDVGHGYVPKGSGAEIKTAGRAKGAAKSAAGR